MPTFPFLSLVSLYLLVSIAAGYARLGDSIDQAEARYGLPRKESRKLPPLLDGAREAMYHYEGWLIRCAYARAVDGQEYVIRQEYRKLNTPEALKKGGTLKIQDFELDAILQGESNGTKWKNLAALPAAPGAAVKVKTPSKPGPKVFQRPDGARAAVAATNDSILFDLPQTAKYEADVKAFRQQEQRERLPAF